MLGLLCGFHPLESVGTLIVSVAKRIMKIIETLMFTKTSLENGLAKVAIL